MWTRLVGVVLSRWSASGLITLCTVSENPSVPVFRRHLPYLGSEVKSNRKGPSLSGYQDEHLHLVGMRVPVPTRGGAYLRLS